jgi:flagellar biosynthetic protein FlhB
MAESWDDGQKTEDPSQRRLDRAREEGRIAQSREINTWFMLGTAGLILLFLGPSLTESIARSLAAFADPAQFLAGDDIAWGTVTTVLARTGTAVLAPLGMLLVAAVAGTVIQTGFILATERISFDVSHLSPLKGLTRLLSVRGLVEMVKSSVKVIVVGLVMAVMLRGEITRLSYAAILTPQQTVVAISHLVLHLLLGILCVLTAMAGADYFYQRLQHFRSLRMSKREVREEMKQSEGDPLIRARLRQIRTDRARRRMMAAVPGASVVITNPTHYAVALKYEMGAAGAPTVVAKGADLVALKIREVAEENDVPIVENPPLARALHANVGLDQEIPAEHYKAVAEIIGYVFRLKGKIKPREAAV